MGLCSVRCSVPRRRAGATFLPSYSSTLTKYSSFPIQHFAPDRGYTRVKAYAVGEAPGVNPILAGTSAQWLGLMLGRDLAVGSDRGQVLQGDATIHVEFGATGITADVLFSGIAVIGGGAARPDIEWHDLAMEEDAFERHESPSERIRGRFYGPGQQEVGGIFERGTITGALGGVRD